MPALDRYLQMLIKVGEAHKRSAKRSTQYAVWLVEAEMFLGKNHYKDWFLSEEPATFFTWSKLQYTFSGYGSHPLNNYTFVLIEV